MASTRTPRGRWIEEGLRALAEGGPSAIRIELLAKAMGVTKGGFYGYFDDRAALIAEMLDSWERTSVDEMIERVERGEPASLEDLLDRFRRLELTSESDLLQRFEGPGRVRLLRLFALSLLSDELLNIDRAVRDWARREPRIAERLRRVDNRRMDYMRSLFAEFCPDEDDAEARCFLAFSIWVGNPLIAAEHRSRTRAEVLLMAALRVLE